MKKRRATHDDVVEVQLQVANGGLSSYELERLENIRQNKVFLSSINLFQATEELRQLNRPKPSPRRLVRTKAAAKETLPPRKSLRLQHKEPETLPSELGALLVTPRKPPGPLPLEPVNIEEGSKLPPRLRELWSKGSTVERKTWLDLNEYSSALKRMRATEGRVDAECVSSAAFHPCASSLLMATGDKLGKVRLWKLGGDGGTLLFEPHSGPVSCMAFSRAQPTQLLSLSSDGSLRCMEVEKAVFRDVYGSTVGLRTFDFMSLDCFTLVVGNRLGDVAIVDRRTPGNTHESLHSLDPNTLRCVSVHPSLKHYFAVAESEVVNIYDCRYLKSTHCQPVSQLHGHSSSITSAYFSPCTGNRVLTTCMDNRIRIYDTAARTTTSPLVTSIRHNMQTLLTKLSAVWDPKREDCFVAGSVFQSRMALAFHESGELQHSFIDREDLQEVLSAIAIHPTRNAFLGCAASGRLHVFSD